MIENKLTICHNLDLVEMANDEDRLSEFLLPFISEHRRNYGTILALGDIATIEFEHESVWMRSRYDEIGSCGFTDIRRFTRRKLESVSWWIAHYICTGMHEKPYRPDIEKAFDYDC